MRNGFQELAFERNGELILFAPAAGKIKAARFRGRIGGVEQGGVRLAIAAAKAPKRSPFNLSVSFIRIP
jgi:hypothetical protein